jgi:hypothetical protein
LLAVANLRVQIKSLRVGSSRKLLGSSQDAYQHFHLKFLFPPPIPPPHIQTTASKLQLVLYGAPPPPSPPPDLYGESGVRAKMELDSGPVLVLGLALVLAAGGKILSLWLKSV